MAGRDRYFVGESYGGTARCNPNSKLVEWEWVHAGRAFAHSHPMGRIGGGIYVILLFLVARICVVLWGVFVGESSLFLIWCAIELMAVLALLCRWRIAWPIVWFSLITSLPFSVPLVLYWADGTRPNLIYRHRFERLVWPRESAAYV